MSNIEKGTKACSWLRQAISAGSVKFSALDHTEECVLAEVWFCLPRVAEVVRGGENCVLRRGEAFLVQIGHPFYGFTSSPCLGGKLSKVRQNRAPQVISVW